MWDFLADEGFEDMGEFFGVVAEAVELGSDGDNIGSCYFDTFILDAF